MFPSFGCAFPSQGVCNISLTSGENRNRGSTGNKHFPQLRFFTLEKLLSSLAAACQN